MIASFITFVLSNFTLTFFVLGLVAAAISLTHHRPLTAPRVVEAVFAYFLMFTMGLSLFYNFVFHVFFGTMAAEFIGWAQSPFQLEVGFASLSFSVVGFMAFWGGFGVRATAVIAHTIFSFGAVGGHIYQMIANNNYAPGNAGVIFYTGIALPLIGLVLLWLQHRLGYETLRAPRKLPREEPVGN